MASGWILQCRSKCKVAQYESVSSVHMNDKVSYKYNGDITVSTSHCNKRLKLQQIDDTMEINGRSSESDSQIESNDTVNRICERR